MSAVISIDELLAYSDAEWLKWKAWLTEHPEALEARVQTGGVLTTVARSVFHVFMAADWHVSRMREEPWRMPEAPPGIPAVWAYGETVRARLKDFLANSDADLNLVREFPMRDQTIRMSHRKALFVMMVHEIRHLAQIALAVRNAGLEPPGKHDLFYSDALE